MTPHITANPSPNSTHSGSCVARESDSASCRGLCALSPKGYQTTLFGANLEKCPVNFFQNGLSLKCKQCPPITTYTDRGGLTNVNECECTAGHAWQMVAGFTGCAQCPPRSYKSAAGFSSCMACPPNATSLPASVALVACRCDADFTGPFGGSCTACPANAQSVTASLEPTACRCNAGFTGNNGSPCVSCVAGTYKDAVGSSSCTACPAGTFSSTVAGTSIQVCVSCHAGTYSGQSGADSNSTCQPCPPGTSTRGQQRQTSTLGCLPCLVGTYAADPKGNAQCDNCPIDTYSNQVAATSLAACLMCSSTQVSVPQWQQGGMRRETCFSWNRQRCKVKSLNRFFIRSY